MIRKFILGSFASIAMTLAAGALAQSSTPYSTPIGTDAAKKIASAAIAECKKNNWFMAVAVTDNNGDQVHFEKMDNTQIGSINVSIGKAKSAALFRRPTKAFQDVLAAGGEGLRILALQGAVPIEGGLPIIVDGKIIGAVGCSGGSSAQDGQACKAGIDGLK